jgi:hypothetical protein
MEDEGGPLPDHEDEAAGMLAVLRELGYELAEARATPASLDADVLNAAILDELAELWGEPADSISRQVRPQVARSIVARYLARLTSKEERS